MKKFIIFGIIICLLIFIIYVIVDIRYGWHIEIASKIEIQIPLSCKLEKKDTHRWISWRWRIFRKNIFNSRTV